MKRRRFGRLRRLGGATHTLPRGTCGKKCFRSIAHAKEAHRMASYRIRVYSCEHCNGLYHVANAEKV